MAVGDKVFIADKVTLDAVKTDTTNILSKDVGFSNANSLILYSTLATNSGWKTILTVTGKGNLISLTSAKSTGALVKITIDGVVVINSFDLALKSFTPLLSFNRSLIIEGDPTGGNFALTVAYNLL